MDISGLFNSPYGMYITQSFCHAVIAAFIVHIALEVWKIEDPLIRQRFRLIVILFPIVSFPLYQMINPERSSLSFRFGALFDASRWMNLELWGSVPLGVLFLSLLVFTTGVFLLQELIPIIQHAIAASHEVDSAQVLPGSNSSVDQALAMLPDPKPDVFIIDDDDLLLFSTTGKRPAVYLSAGFINELSVEELEVAIAHEIGHIIRSKRPLLVWVFLLRVAMFFSPVALMEFRKIVQEEEKICDDFAVSLTGRRQSLAETLRRFDIGADAGNPASSREILRLPDRVEEYSHAMSIKGRISRLEKTAVEKGGGEWIVFILTLAAIVVINYSVV
jgi:hypothetical protein